jgi:hypothetical protein
MIDLIMDALMVLACLMAAVIFGTLTWSHRAYALKERELEEQRKYLDDIYGKSVRLKQVRRMNATRAERAARAQRRLH